MEDKFREALEKEFPLYDKETALYIADNKCKRDGAEWAYTYLQKEGGKDLVTGVHQDSNDIGDAPLESSNSIEQEEKYKLGYKDGWDDAALYERRKADAIYWQNEYEKLCKEGCSNCGERF